MLSFNLKQYKPLLLKHYVSSGIRAAQLVLVPVNHFMKHLILAQGLDPNAIPGRNAFKDLQQLFTGIPALCNLEWSQVEGLFHRNSRRFPETMFMKLKHNIWPKFDVNQFQNDEASQAEELFVAPDEKNMADAMNTLKYIASKLETKADNSRDVVNSIIVNDKRISQDLVGDTDPKELFARTDYLKTMKDAFWQNGELAEKLSAIKTTKPKPSKKKLNKTTRPKAKSKVVTIQDDKFEQQVNFVVEKQADVLHELITQGKVSPLDFDGLIEEGLDKEVVDAWINKYGQFAPKG